MKTSTNVHISVNQLLNFYQHTTGKYSNILHRQILIYDKQYKRKSAGLEGKELSSNLIYDLEQFTSSVFFLFSKMSWGKNPR